MNISAGMSVSVSASVIAGMGWDGYICMYIFYAQFDKRASWKRDLNGRLSD